MFSIYNMKFKKNNQRQIIILLVVVILVYVVYRLIQYFRARPVAISPALLHDVLKPGTYKGVGEYTPTKSHSDGIVTTNVATIEKGEHNSIHYTNTLTAKNKKTNQVVYNAIRKGDFFYKSNHGNQLFLEAKSYINNEVVSSQYGYANSFTDNSISFLISSTWYIDQTTYEDAIKTVQRNGDKLSHKINHIHMLGFKGLGIEENFILQ